MVGVAARMRVDEPLKSVGTLITSGCRRWDRERAIAFLAQHRVTAIPERIVSARETLRLRRTEAETLGPAVDYRGPSFASCARASRAGA